MTTGRPQKAESAGLSNAMARVWARKAARASSSFGVAVGRGAQGSREGRTLSSLSVGAAASSGRRTRTTGLSRSPAARPP